MRGQVAIEYILIFAFSLAALGAAWYTSGTNIQDTQWEIQVAYAKSALTRITEGAEVNYLQGPPSQSYVYPNFPDNVKNVYVSSTAVTLELTWKNGLWRNISIETAAVLNGSLGNYAGTHKILLRARDGFVQLSEA
jgi:hypothetical protein